MKELIIKNTKEIRLDDFLSGQYPLLKSPILNKALRQNKLKVNGKKPLLSQKIKNGDVVRLYLPDDYFLVPTAQNAYLFSFKHLDIIYEDENLFIVNKPAGIPVIDENWENYDTLINRVLHYCHLNNIDTNFIPALCHRLDTGTQGLIVLAKTQKALDFMLAQFQAKSLEKTYLAVVKGIPKTAVQTHHAFLSKNSAKGFVTISQKAMTENAKPIETKVRLLQNYQDFSLLEIGLITGRTHQIRAHLSWLNLPILGDSRYGTQALNRKYKMKYQALCSYKLKFGQITQPDFAYLSGREFVCPIPWFVESFYNHEF